MLHRISAEGLPVEVAWLYAESGGNLADLRKLEDMGLVRLEISETWRDPLTNIDPLPTTQPPLTRDQVEVWTILRESLQQAASGKPQKPFLLHGVTGSGKTEIYLQSVGETLRLGRQAIILVPEIALTPQTVRRFLARFPGQVGLLHSGLSEGERYDTWRRARLGELNVIVGPRSALFSPLQRIGLIVVDESHDTTYYQSDTLPHYHAREAAVLYAALCGAVCLLGSATPQITSRYRADQGEWRYLSLPDRILAHKETIQAQLKRIATATQATSHYLPFDSQAESIQLPPVQVVDMRAELKAGNRSIFSLALQAALDRVLQSNQQAILFLNRRGAATYVFCRDCGYSLKCPQCEIPLTMHGKSRAAPTLICHHCGYQRKAPAKCPQCGSNRIRHYGTGTERVESEVINRFPEVRTLRWDYETTRQKGAHEMILNHFANHHADILIGTQMIAKGLDLPLVTLVGVVLADVGLNLPDAFAPERTFQTLTQVSGRAGRSPLGGEVILQTFQPEHYVIQAAAGHDYGAFYRQELLYRAPLEYPPFGNLVRLEYRHTDSDQAERAARSLADQIHTWIQEEGRSSIHLAGPVPCFFARLSGQYRWQILLHGPDPASLLRGRQFNDWRIEVNPPSLL